MELEVFEFKEKLVKLANESKLPLVIKQYVFQEVTTAVQRAAEQQIDIQKQQR